MKPRFCRQCGNRCTGHGQPWGAQACTCVDPTLKRFCADTGARLVALPRAYPVLLVAAEVYELPMGTSGYDIELSVGVRARRFYR